ncbi:MAG: M48 family metallopeptidase [Hyphomonadaceae bacterium]|nr:M48 family metallopeptidase [Hyphomonadaceae bacterium]
MTPPLDRRRLLALFAGTLAFPAACSENPATGRRQLALVSDEMLAQMAQTAWADILRQTPRAPDAGLQRRLEAIGARVVSAAGVAQGDWEFVVFDSPEINAFVLPGGKVGFFRGLMDLADDDAAIAAVMGHEVGHVSARHAAERMTQQLAVQAGMTVASIALSESLGQYADEAAAALGAGLIYGVVLPYSRTHEFEADRLGVRYMADADYPPTAALTFWQAMIARNADRPQPLEFLSTHPADEDRLAALQAEIAKL